MPNYEIETQLEIKGHKVPMLRYAKERGADGRVVDPEKVYDRFYLVKASLEDGMSMQMLASILFKGATEPQPTGETDEDGVGKVGEMLHRPYFMVKRDARTGDQLLGWISAPPHKLRLRMQREGMARVNEQALAAGRIVPMPDWRP